MRKSEGFFARSLTCLSVERVGRYSVYRCQTKSVCISSMKKFTAKLNRRWKETPRKVSTEFFRRNFVHSHLKSSFAELLYLHPNDHTTNLFQICKQTFFYRVEWQKLSTLPYFLSFATSIFALNCFVLNFFSAGIHEEPPRQSSVMDRF